MISAVILTKNSAACLKRCLNALRIFPEVVVVDTGSTDNTLEIARSFTNVSIFHEQFTGFGETKNKAVSLATHDWVLLIDSDEVLEPGLASSILGFSLKEDTVYRFYRKNYYDNLLIDGCSWDNDYVVRLFNRKVTKFNANKVHESIITANLQVITLSPGFGFIYHFPYANTRELMAKLEHYATLYALNNLGNKKVNLALLPLKVIVVFIKNYLLKKGFLYGYEGFLISSYNAIGVLVKYLKLHELGTKRKLAIAVRIEDKATDLDYIIKQINQQQLLPAQVIFLINYAISDDDADAAMIGDRVARQLVVPATIIGMIDQDSNVVLETHLGNNQDLDGIVLYYKLSALENDKLVYISRGDLQSRCKASYGYGKFFYKHS